LGSQQDYDCAITEINAEQRIWFENALRTMNPQWHAWLKEDAAQ
jgi:hypothetical protein